VLDRQVKFLRPIGAVGRHHDGDVGQRAQRAAVTRRQGQHLRTLRPRRFRRPNHVRRIPARRVHHEQVAGADQRLDLAREHLLEAEIVRGRGEE
jgi:hypothetical protein